MTSTSIPAHLSAVDESRIIDLDVREDLRAGREPFSRIMEARRALPEDGVLRLRAIFEPYPLYGVMERQGLSHWTERLADDDWRVWFFAANEEPSDARSIPSDSATTGSCAGHASPEEDPGPEATEEAAPTGDGVESATTVVLDVRGLEPPEPMVRTLERLETLQPGATLVQLNERIPRFLLPQLEERGFSYHVRQQSPDLVRVFITR